MFSSILDKPVIRLYLYLLKLHVMKFSLSYLTNTIKILKIGTPKIITVIVLKMEKFAFIMQILP